MDKLERKIKNRLKFSSRLGLFSTLVWHLESGDRRQEHRDKYHEDKRIEQPEAGALKLLFFT